MNLRININTFITFTNKTNISNTIQNKVKFFFMSFTLKPKMLFYRLFFTSSILFPNMIEQIVCECLVLTEKLTLFLVNDIYFSFKK